MGKQQLKIFAVGILLVAALGFLYCWSDAISPRNTGTYFDYEKLARSAIVIAIAIAIIRMVFLSFISPLEKRHQKQVPSVIKYLIGAVILAIAAIFIVTNVYDQSALILFIGLGTSGVGILYVAQDSLKDLFRGIAIAFQGIYKVGDWIKFPDGTVGQITKTNLTRMELTQVDSTVLYVTNSMVTNQAMVNLSRPDTPFYGEVKVMLEHDVSVERARRMLLTATINAHGIADKDVSVVAESVQLNGIIFAAYFKVPDYAELISVKHNVISSIVEHLHRHDLKVCELSGQYNIMNVDADAVKKFNDAYVTDELSALKFSGLLKNCTQEVQKQFAKDMQKLVFSAGKTICAQGEAGDTMYIIAEGVVNVIVKVSADDKDESKKGAAEVVTTLSDGDYFGEMALLCGDKRNATIVAKTNVVLYEISRNTVKAYIEKSQDFAKKLSTAIVERNRSNQMKRSEALKNSSKRDSSISELMSAFRIFLGG